MGDDTEHPRKLKSVVAKGASSSRVKVLRTLKAANKESETEDAEEVDIESEAEADDKAGGEVTRDRLRAQLEKQVKADAEEQRAEPPGFCRKTSIRPPARDWRCTNLKTVVIKNFHKVQYAALYQRRKMVVSGHHYQVLSVAKWMLKHPGGMSEDYDYDYCGRREAMALFWRNFVISIHQAAIARRRYNIVCVLSSIR
uniref:Uncharacterized protein n=1 Tax=Oryza punctata TaxID=4537 RepID=A0A0E0JZA7_ORYPU